MRRRQLWSGAAALLILLAAAPRPGQALHALTHPAVAAPTEPLVAAVALLAWTLAAWLAAAAVLTRLGALPGLVGRASRVLLGRLAPRAVRRALAVALGVSVTLGTAGAATAGATPTGSAAVQLDWPTGAGTTATDLDGSYDWPTGAAAPAPAHATPSARPAAPAPTSTGPTPTGPTPTGPTSTRPTPAAPAATGTTPTATGTTATAPTATGPSTGPRTGTAARPSDRGGTVVVRPGDSLWRLARERLPADATPARVAAAWPAWWSANREVLGDDPDLLHVGTRLRVPPPDTSR